MKKIGFGIIGCGGISNYFHIPELKAIEEAEVVAVADIKEERARLTAERFNIKFWYSDYMKLLERNDVDAVVVATPHPTHAKIAVDAINAGKHVIIQKPMCTNSKDAEAIVNASRKRSDLKVMVLPFVYFDTPAFDYVRDLLNSGDLGKICMARSRVAHGGPEKYQEEVARMFGEEKSCWFFDLERAHGGVLLDLGVYAISQIVYLLGKVKSVSALTATLDKPAKVEDNCALLMEMENGAISIAETSWTQVATLEGTSIYGTKGTVLLNYFNTPVAFYRQKDSSWIMPVLAKEKEPQHTHRHFIKCILSDLKPIGSPEEGKHVVEIMEAAYESAKTGKTIKLKT
ncbi:MAG: Gfo/Idh/MocA family oxidoreductase [Candidatus Bathyarchaeia archaeon]